MESIYEAVKFVFKKRYIQGASLGNTAMVERVRLEPNFTSPVLIGESAYEQSEILRQLKQEIEPKNIVETMYVADVATITFEILRLRRAKIAIINTSYRLALQNVLAQLLRTPGELVITCRKKQKLSRWLGSQVKRRRRKCQRYLVNFIWTSLRSRRKPSGGLLRTLNGLRDCWPRSSCAAAGHFPAWPITVRAWHISCRRAQIVSSRQRMSARSNIFAKNQRSLMRGWQLVRRR
jgi:hypothetical protein